VELQLVSPATELLRVAKRNVQLDETPLTFEGVSEYIIKGKVGEILPRIVKEVKRLKYPED
jgi:hypothetical protein